MPDRKATGRIRGFMAVLALCSVTMFASCLAEPEAWYPSGKAVIASYYEYSNSGGNGCVAAVEITNIGRSSPTVAPCRYRRRPRRAYTG